MPILRLAAILAATALALGACGVRGPLEPPPGAAASAADASQPADPAPPERPLTRPDAELFEDGQRTERVIQSQRRTHYPPASDRFILDPLL